MKTDDFSWRLSASYHFLLQQINLHPLHIVLLKQKSLFGDCVTWWLLLPQEIIVCQTAAFYTTFWIVETVPFQRIWSINHTLSTVPSYSNENLSFKWELQLSIHCHFCPCCLLYCCHPFLPSFLWVNKMEDQRRPQILKSGVQRGCRALSNKIRNHFWRKIRYFC